MNIKILYVLSKFAKISPRQYVQASKILTLIDANISRFTVAINVIICRHIILMIKDRVRPQLIHQVIHPNIQ